MHVMGKLSQEQPLSTTRGSSGKTCDEQHVHVVGHKDKESTDPSDVILDKLLIAVSL